MAALTSWTEVHGLIWTPTSDSVAATSCLQEIMASSASKNSSATIYNCTEQDRTKNQKLLSEFNLSAPPPLPIPGSSRKWRGQQEQGSLKKGCCSDFEGSSKVSNFASSAKDHTRRVLRSEKEGRLGSARKKCSLMRRVKKKSLSYAS